VRLYIRQSKEKDKNNQSIITWSITGRVYISSLQMIQTITAFELLKEFKLDFKDAVEQNTLRMFKEQSFDSKFEPNLIKIVLSYVNGYDDKYGVDFFSITHYQYCIFVRAQYFPK